MLNNESHVGIYIMSCDKTSDVANYFVKSFNKFCKDLPFPIFFGVNDNFENATELSAFPIKSERSNWREESLIQLNQIKKKYKQISHLIVILDDFIFLQSSHKKIHRLINESVEKQIKYIRFKPIEENFILKIYNLIRLNSGFKTAKIVKIRKSHPYYSSLQIALWNIDYLIDMISNSSSIWDFENQKSPEIHYSTIEKFMFYKHIVEKGEWDLNAKEICTKYLGSFNPGFRKVRTLSKIQLMNIFVRKISFFLFGYFFMNLRKKIEI